MRTTPLGVIGGLTLVLCLGGIVLSAQVLRKDSEQLRQKMDAINAYAQQPAAGSHRTVLTQNELNAFLAYDAHDQLPKGVLDPVITIVGTGRLSGRALVDLDAVRGQYKPTTMLDPANLLTGRVPVTAVGLLKTANGTGRFELESATLSGVPIPKTLLQQVVNYYSRSPQNPSGISLDTPFPLPARIREIQVEPGQAVVIQ